MIVMFTKGCQIKGVKEGQWPSCLQGAGAKGANVPFLCCLLIQLFYIFL